MRILLAIALLLLPGLALGGEPMRLKMKPSVRIRGMKPQMALAIMVVKEAYRDAGVDELVITSGEDSTHSRQSKHYVGAALDFRVHNVPPDRLRGVAAVIQEGLGSEYDVILEAVGTPNAHLHVEYDPKGPM